jgi:hypothetical protein
VKKLILSAPVYVLSFLISQMAFATSATTIDLGMLVGQNPEHTLITLCLARTEISAADKFSFGMHRRSLTDTGLQTYTHSHGRAEIGTGVGLLATNLGGLRLLGGQKEQGTYFHLGMEPFNLMADTHMYRNDYIEWLPMITAGVHIIGGSETSNWNLLVMGRAGGAVGTLGTSGGRPTFGAGILATASTFNMAIDLLRIRTRDVPVDFAIADLTWQINPDMGVGLRGESKTFRNSGSDSQTEYQGMLFIRFATETGHEEKPKGVSL